VLNPFKTAATLLSERNSSSLRLAYGTNAIKNKIRNSRLAGLETNFLRIHRVAGKSSPIDIAGADTNMLAKVPGTA